MQMATIEMVEPKSIKFTVNVENYPVQNLIGDKVRAHIIFFADWNWFVSSILWFSFVVLDSHTESD